MERKQYLVKVQILEARGLQKNGKREQVDPFVEINCGNCEAQTTFQRFRTNNAVWNQSFTFSDLSMNIFELESFELIFKVFTVSSVTENILLGQHSIGLSTMYRNSNHEYFRTWIQLIDPSPEADQNVVQGYLRVSCFIVGPNERPPVHGQEDGAENEDIGSESEVDEQEILDKMQMNQGISQVDVPNFFQKTYQLTINISKGESLMGDELEKGISTFISVRTQGLTLSTKSMALKKNKDMNFSQRLFFPVRVPTFNDKITIRLWQNIAGKVYGETVSFQSNIPEKPSIKDFANISALIPKEGKMDRMWVNLYGIKFSERNDSRPQGNSQYMGRVLMSLHISENEKPLFQVTSNPAANEPEVGKYKLYLDTYEMVNCDDLLEHQISIQATVGPYYTPQKKDAKLDPTSKKFFKWKNIKTEKKEVIEDLPLDPEQCPDVIVYVFAKPNSTFGGNERRIGFVRLTAKSVIRNDPRPNWYVVMSIENTIKEIGLLLMNVQLRSRNQNGGFPEHVPAKRGKQIPYLFFAQILSGFEIAPHFSEQSLKTMVKVQIGSDITNEIKTEFKDGRFPLYNRSPVARHVTLDSNVSFSSDMRVTLYNQSYSIFGSYEKILGCFMVPVMSITQFYTYPQFYNVIDDSGNMIGKILARFYLYKKPTAKSDEIEKKIREHMVSQFLKLSDKFDVTFSVLGLRNLARVQRSSKIRVSFTKHLFSLKQETTKGQTPNDESTQNKIEDLENRDCIILSAESDAYTTNINFGRSIRFKDVEMSLEPLLWPWLIIDEIDSYESQVLSRALVPLFVYADSVFDDLKQKFTIAMFKNIGIDKAENFFDQDQMQISPVRHYYNAMIEKIEKQSKKFYQDVELDVGIVLFQKEKIEEEVEEHLKCGQMKLTFDQGRQQGEEKEGEKVMGAKIIGAYVETEDDEANPLVPDNQIKTQAEPNEEDDNVFRTQSKDPYKIIHYREEYSFNLKCTQEDKKKESQLKELAGRKVSKLIDYLMVIQDEAKAAKLVAVTESARIELQKLRKQQEDFEEQKVMNQDDFTYNPVQADNLFDYGERKLLTNDSLESQLSAPFKDFQFMTEQKGFFTSEFSYEFLDGIYRSGKRKGNFIRCNLTVQRSSDREALEEEVEEETPALHNLNASGEEHDEKNNKLEEKIFEMYDFDPMKPEVLAYLLNPTVQYKVRVYVLSCQNLSATDSAVDFAGKLAGIKAMSSADPYPVITIGTGQNGEGNSKFIRSFSDSEKALDKTLNPQFFRYYELDCILPQDLKMVVAIWDKGNWGDTLIGQTEIDLELRRFGDKYFQARELVNIRLKQVQEEIKQLIKAKGKDKKPNLEKQKRLQQEESKLIEYREDFRTKANKMPKQSVEFRELKNQTNSQTQGIIQMWCEIVTLDEHRLNPPEQLIAPNIKEEYEVRLIIWETRDVPLGDQGKVSLYVKATMINDEFSESNVEKKTDTHNNIEDGKGVYNYRMCFTVKLPAEFPRIVLQIYDEGFISETCQSETILNVKNAINLYKKNGQKEMKKVWASFNTPGSVQESAGFVLISLQVFSETEAKDSPAGDGQSAPNDNPKLEKPTVGRGYGEVLASMGITLPSITLPSFTMFRNIMIVVIIVIVLAVVGFLMWYLKPPV